MGRPGRSRRWRWGCEGEEEAGGWGLVVWWFGSLVVWVLVLKFFLDLSAKMLVSWCFGGGWWSLVGWVLGFGNSVLKIFLDLSAKMLVSLGFLGLDWAWAGLGLSLGGAGLRAV